MYSLLFYVPYLKTKNCVTTSCTIYLHFTTVCYDSDINHSTLYWLPSHLNTGASEELWRKLWSGILYHTLTVVSTDAEYQLILESATLLWLYVEVFAFFNIHKLHSFTVPKTSENSFILVLSRGTPRAFILIKFNIFAKTSSSKAFQIFISLQNKTVPDRYSIDSATFELGVIRLNFFVPTICYKLKSFYNYLIEVTCLCPIVWGRLLLV
jgi:hypothetical protein